MTPRVAQRTGARKPRSVQKVQHVQSARSEHSQHARAPGKLPTPAARSFVWNQTQQSVLADRGSVLRNPLRQAIGTMFHKLPGSYVFVFPWETRVAITNLFVFEPLDILWLDSRGRVTHLRERFPPFALHAGTPKPAKYVVELPAGAIAASRTRMGDTICVESLVMRTDDTSAKPF